jgi:hypothetical protein
VSARKNEYTDTVRDVKALIRREADEDKRAALAANIDKMALQIERQRDQLTDLRVLSERVDGLVWLVRGVILTCALEIIAGLVVAMAIKGHA